MDLSSYNSVLAPSGILSGAATLWYYGRKILKEIKKSKEESANKILEEAKRHTNQVKSELETKISLLESEIHSLEENVSKDFSNLKETHAIELKNLSEKVELLREDLQTQHSQILSLLVQLVDKS